MLSHGALSQLTLSSGCQSASFLGLRRKKFDSEMRLLNKRNVPYGKLKSSATFNLDRTLYMRGQILIHNTQPRKYTILFLTYLYCSIHTHTHTHTYIYIYICS